MTDGLGIAASSDLVYQENNIPDESLNNLMEQYYGIQTYHVIDDPNNTYIDHIDCWGKYLSHTKVLIRGAKYSPSIQPDRRDCTVFRKHAQ